MISAYVKPLADYLGEKKVEPEELIEGEAGEGPGLTDESEETEAEMNVNAEESSRSQPEQKLRNLPGANGNKDEGSRSQQGGTESRRGVNGTPNSVHSHSRTQRTE